MTIIEANGVDATELARVLGISRQRAPELAESAPDFPRPTHRLGPIPSPGT